MKSTGSGHFYPTIARRLPIATRYKKELLLRVCASVCLTAALR